MTMPIKWASPRAVGLVVAALAAAAGVTVSSCSQTPTNVPIRTFEGAQKVAVVCLQVADPATGLATSGAIPVAQSLCAPVASDVAGSLLPYHLIAMVTQTTRGELAAVDLTSGAVIDEDQSTPGINFIPVGTNPTDVVVAPGDHPDVTYVSSGSPTKAAIFAIHSNRLLGDSTAYNARVANLPPLLFTDLAACSLPQPPVALAVMSTAAETTGDGAAPDGGAAMSRPYELVALLGPRGSTAARIVVIDHSRLDGNAPGGVAPCTILGSRALSADVPTTVFRGVPWPDGVAYVEGGVGDLSAHEPATVPSLICSNDAGEPVNGGLLEAGAAPAATPAIDGGTGVDGAIDAEAAEAGNAAADDAAGDDANAASAPDTGAPAVPPAFDAGAGFAFAVSPLSSPRPVSMVMRDDAPLLYVADSSLPVIHVIDLRDPTAPAERSPLIATSLSQPTRQVKLGTLALSPSTRSYKRYLYAVDSTAGSLMVFDVTDTAATTSPQMPLVRPHAELNPFVPPDRVTFAAPVAAVAFAQHDWPLVLPSTTKGDPSIAYDGLLCNPNPNAHPQANNAFLDLGAYYRVDQAGVIQTNATVQNFPTRLRGIFAFATLTNGTVVTIDVDDWDAPCRRPDPMSADGGMTGSLDIPESAPMDTQDLDPYHAPLTYQSQNQLKESPAVTLEQFFPVSAPHRVRSSVLLRNDPTSGNHLPSVVQLPQLSDVNGTPVATSGKEGVAEPQLLPTGLEPDFSDPTLVQNPTEPDPNARTPVSNAPDGGTPNPQAFSPPGVRLSFDDPTVQQSQDWTVAYEGVLPSSPGIVATMQSTSPEGGATAYTTLDFATQGADLCGLGIEDWTLGQARANAALCAMDPALVSVTEAKLPQWTADYVEITDDILPQGDAYWGISGNTCWNIDGAPPAIRDGQPNEANARYGICQATFGRPGTDPDLNINRDAPILEAYKDHLKVGRFAHVSSQVERTQNRTVDPGGPNNPTYLKLMACCFHKQAAFKVRAGGEWVAVGQQGIGLLHHVVPASSDPSASRCVLSTDPQNKLLNARSFDVPWATTPTCSAGARPVIDRNSPLAMRNPMFSYVTWAGCSLKPFTGGDHTLAARDLTWKFSITGAFSPLTISLAGTTGARVSPQSMLFVNSLGQLAVVDGADQGLVLIDLNSVGFAVNYF